MFMLLSLWESRWKGPFGLFKKVFLGVDCWTGGFSDS